MFLYDIDDACSITELTPELESFILNSTRSQDVSLLLASAIGKDAVDIYEYIVENYGLKRYGKAIFSFALFKHQHEAHLHTMKYVTNRSTSKVAKYIEDGLLKTPVC